MTNNELDKTSETLDYYCKKYFSMEYSAHAINTKTNSYLVSIIFTNYQVIANFIMELSKILNTKINLLDNKALAENRLKEISTKTFSVKQFNKYDLIKLLGKSGTYFMSPHLMLGDAKNTIAGGTLGIILGSLEKLNSIEGIKEGLSVKSNMLQKARSY